MSQEKLQAVYNKVKEHLLMQGKKSEAEDGTCMYRGKGGLQCAIGCLIPDSLYSFDLEERMVYNFNDEEEDILDVLGEAGIDIHAPKMPELLLDLQKTHDNVEASRWGNHLELVVAPKYNLTP